MYTYLHILTDFFSVLLSFKELLFLYSMTFYSSIPIFLEPS